jgi:hypothetical protein
MAISATRRRAHVMMPAELLRAIDALVGQRKRSQFIQEAVEEKLALMRRAEAFDRVVGSIADGDVPAWETRESTEEWLRELRQGPQCDDAAISETT